MAALNQSETEALRRAVSVLDGILREGYDPNDDSARGKLRTVVIKDAKDQVHTVVTMKGYYAK